MQGFSPFPTHWRDQQSRGPFNGNSACPGVFFLYCGANKRVDVSNVVEAHCRAFLKVDTHLFAHVVAMYRGMKLGKFIRCKPVSPANAVNIDTEINDDSRRRQERLTGP